MRISDWSSDVCSSDLADSEGRGESLADVAGHAMPAQSHAAPAHALGHEREARRVLEADEDSEAGESDREEPERKSVGSGKSVSVRVALGGGRTIKKKKQPHTTPSQTPTQHTTK